MNELTLLQSEIKTQEEYTQQEMAILQTKMLSTSKISILNILNSDYLISSISFMLSSASLILPAFSAKLDKSERFSDSEKFIRKRNKLHSFLTQLRNKLKENVD
jgi:hypothetical protein